MLDSQTQITASGGGLTMAGTWYIGTSGLGSGGSTPGTLNGPLTGNADTATQLKTARNINGVGFDGSQAITVGLNTTSTATTGTYYVPFVSSNSTGNQQAYTNGNFSINPNSGTLSLGGAINATNLPSSSTIGASVSISANASLSGSSSGTNTGDQNLSGYLTTSTASATYAPLASPTFTGYVTIPNTLNMSAAAGSPSISFNNGGVLTPQQTLGTYQGVGAQTSVGLVFGHASPGGTPTGATYIEIGNTATADGSNAQLWVKSDTSQIQVLSQASGNSSAAGGGSAGLYGNSTNGMFLWENTGSVIKFVIGSNLSTPQLNITNSVSTATSTTSAPVTVSSGLGVNGNVYATNYYGNGSNLTGITSPVTSVNGQTGDVTLLGLGFLRGVDTGGNYVNGYQQFPGGLIIQWGQISQANRATEYDFGTLSFPINFPNACVSVTATIWSGDSSAGLADNFAVVHTFSTTSFNLWSGSTVTGTRTYGITWMAIGY